MSRHIDAALEAIDQVLDVGAQTPEPDPTFGEVSPEVRADECARCGTLLAAGDFCPPCRAYLLGDHDDDPVEALVTLCDETGDVAQLHRSAVTIHPDPPPTAAVVESEVHVPASVPAHRALAWIDRAREHNRRRLADLGYPAHVHHDVVVHHRREGGTHRWTVTTAALTE